MKYICTNCSYVYDESSGDEVEEIEAGTKIDSLDCCPVCLETDGFFQLKEEVIYLDENTVDKVELEHLPDINHDWINIEVTVWNNSHLMEKEHRILSIWLFDEYWDLVEEKFLWIDDDTVVVFDDYDLDEIEIRVRCSKHWIFGKKFELTY